MEVIRNVADMKDWSSRMRQKGVTIGFVPTMGYFHEGHLQLMRRCRKQVDKMVVSLFVNPTQFGPMEDLDKYPRSFNRDNDLAAQEKADVLFAPITEAMYPQGFTTKVIVEKISEGLCGARRPGHFAGVATVVTKLFNIVQPTCAIFGEKDFQQLAIIRRLVCDLDMDIDVQGHPIVRELDGLAMSSRNTYLSIDERKSALCLYESLQMARHLVENGVVTADILIENINNLMLSYPNVIVEYIAIVDEENLTTTPIVDTRSRLALAVKVGNTRLIDNGRLMERGKEKQ
jgi:pantoate--beta-alanine ligase